LQHPTPDSVIGILRSTLRRIEESQEMPKDDPALIQLRKHILRSIAELEVLRSAESAAEPIPANSALGIE
jgi:hypothetical protein